MTIGLIDGDYSYIRTVSDLNQHPQPQLLPQPLSQHTALLLLLLPQQQKRITKRTTKRIIQQQPLPSKPHPELHIEKHSLN